MRVMLFLVTILLLSALGAGCLRPNSTRAHDYLQGNYSKMIVEIDYQGDKAPRSGAVDLLKQRIQERCNKPGGVTVLHSSFSSDRTRWSVDDLRAADVQQRGHSTGLDTAVLHILYVAGRYEKDTDSERVLGISFAPSAIAVFKDNVDDAGISVNPLVPLPFSSANIENSVIVHEFGHALGLVNNGIPMVKDHEDKAHPHHSTDRNSVMYWQVESFDVRSFGAPPPTDFDADDKADLRQAGGK